jgi:hypothetical protein
MHSTNDVCVCFVSVLRAVTRQNTVVYTVFHVRTVAIRFHMQISDDVGFNPSTQRHYRGLIYYLYIHTYIYTYHTRNRMQTPQIKSICRASCMRMRATEFRRFSLRWNRTHCHSCKPNVSVISSYSYEISAESSLKKAAAFTATSRDLMSSSGRLPKSMLLYDWQSVRMSWYWVALWNLRPDITSCRNVAIWNLRSCIY